MFVFALLFLLLSSCKWLYENPTVNRIHDIKIHNFDPDSIELGLTLEVNNPNRYDLSLEKLNVKILNRNRIPIGFADLQNEVVIPGKKSTALDFKIRLETRQTIKLIGNTKDDIVLYIEGSGNGKVRGMSKSFVFEHSYALDMKKHLKNILPKFSSKSQNFFRVLSTSVETISLGETTVKVDFLLLNPYGLSFSLSDFPAEIYVNEKPIGKGNLKSPLVFDEKTIYQDGSLIFKLNNLKSLAGAAKGIFKGEIAYEVKANVKIETLGISIDSPYVFKESFSISASKLLLGM